MQKIACLFILFFIVSVSVLPAKDNAYKSITAYSSDSGVSICLCVNSDYYKLKKQIEKSKKRPLSRYVSLEDYCKGDGLTDDTKGFQDAVNTGLNLRSAEGKIYLIGTVTATHPYQIFNLTGCTLKLKDHQKSGIILKLTGIHQLVRGGVLDGNKDNQIVDKNAMYGFAALLLNADYTTASNVKIINSAGIGVASFGVANFVKTDSCYITGCSLSAVFYNGSHTIALKGNAITNNFIDELSCPGATGAFINSYANKSNPDQSQIKNFQKEWRITGNVIKVKNAPNTEDGSAISQRGSDGICANNHLYGGHFAITEGGPNTQIINNVCVADSNSSPGETSLAGIESHFDNNLIAYNYVDGFKYSLMSSANQVSSNLTIKNNTFKDWEKSGIYFNARTIPSRNLMIKDNIFIQQKNNTPAMTLQNDVQGVYVDGDSISGLGSAAILLDKTGGAISISNAKFTGYKIMVNCYSATNFQFDKIHISNSTTNQTSGPNIVKTSLASFGNDFKEDNIIR